MICLANLHEHTEQQVFDQVARHLLTQNEKSISERACLYRGPNGLKCAAGCLISDGEYTTAMDLDTLEETSWEHLIKDGLVPSIHEALISDLQDVHDQQEVKDWKRKLEKLAKQRGLNYTVLKEFQ